LRIALIAAGCTAGLLVGIGLWSAPYSGHRPGITRQSAQHPVEQAYVTREIDLSRYDTTRGVGSDAVEPEPVSLPTSIVHLKITLPFLSPPGHYKVAVAANLTEDKNVATGDGTAMGSDPSGMLLSVTLDLRKARPGSYVLSTESEQDGRACYPLKLH